MGDGHQVRKLVWAAVAGAVLSLCLVVCVGLGAVLVLRGGVSVPWAAATRATPTQTSLPATTFPPLKTASPTPLSTVAQRPTSTATQASVATHTPTPVATSTAEVPTSTPTATRASTATRAATPTPIVCDSLDQMEGLTIAPGQQFFCTIGQQDLTRRINQQPDLPCTNVEVTFASGEIGLTCSLGIKLQATGVVQVENCRMSIRIVKGTVGFTQVVQGLIDEYAQLVPEDLICVEEATVGDGVVEISGYGR